MRANSRGSLLLEVAAVILSCLAAAGCGVLIAGAIVKHDQERKVNYTYSFSCKDRLGVTTFDAGTVGPNSYSDSRTASFTLDGKGTYFPKPGELCTIFKTKK